MSCEETSIISDARRKAAIIGSIQGIDYIETLDHEAPNPDLRRRILLVHCFLPLPADEWLNVHIDGDPESAPPRVQWALPASRFQPPGPERELWIVPGVDGSSRPISDGELEFFGGLSQPETLLIVHIAPQILPEEDRGTYRLRLPASDDPPLDPRLREARFALQTESATDIDCVPADAEASTRRPSPPIDYLAKDYASFRTLMLDRMSVVMPEWTERSPADAGVTLVEILAHVGDQLSYYQDSVATEAYLGTARRRTSVRRHARLLDYPLHEGNNARVWVSIEVNEDYDSPLYAEQSRVIPAGTRLLTRLENERRTGLDDDVEGVAVREGALFFETLASIRPRPARNAMFVYDWDGGMTCLPAGATSAILCVSQGAQLQDGDVLIFEEIADANTGALPDPTRRHAVRLIKSPKEIVDLLTEDALNLIEITWHAADALPFAMPIRHPSGALAAVARGNVVLADHGRTISLEPLVPEFSPGDERYRPHLRGLHLTHRQPYTADASPSSAADLVVQNTRQALPVVSILEFAEQDEDGCDDIALPWYPRRDLLSSGPFDRHFTIEMERGGRASIRFGDNVNGRRPTRGGRFHTIYRVGNGSAGNIGADAIAHVLVPLDGSERSSVMRSGVDVVRNPLPAVGGAEPERDEQARLYAPNSFRMGERAVTADDYAEVTERHPEVQKALAKIHWTGSWDTVFVTVDRRGGLPLDAGFEGELRSYLEPFRMAGQDLEFTPPQFVPLDIAFTVHVEANALRGEVKAALFRTLVSGESATGTRGFFHPDNFTFGDPVYLSQIVATIMQVPGVVWVDVDDSSGKPNHFRRFGQKTRGELGQGVIVVAPFEIIRVDNDPTAPHNGRIELYMEGGL